MRRLGFRLFYSLMGSPIIFAIRNSEVAAYKAVSLSCTYCKVLTNEIFQGNLTQGPPGIDDPLPKSVPITEMTPA
jgi:hypothetical protein